VRKLARRKFLGLITPFRRDRQTRSGGVFICVKNYITFAELRVDEVYEMNAVEVNCRDPKNTWEIVGIYRSPNKDMRLLEKLAHRTRYMGRTMKRIIIGGGLHLPSADWNGHAEVSRETQVLLNRLVWENDYTQAVNSPT